MIRNYITIAFRSMTRNKAHAVINILGLSVGVACCLLLSLYIQDEASYDRHHHDVDRLYQVTSIMGDEGDNRVMRTTSPPIVWGIKDELPEIEKVTRLVNPPGVSQNLIRYGNKQFYESDGYLADSTLFDIFTYHFLSGNPKKALVEANSIVLTEQLAKKIFTDEPALDKIISLNQGGSVVDFKVTGVLAARQSNSHIKANFFVSMTSDGWAEYIRSPRVHDQWAGQNFLLSYIKLRPGYSREDFIPKMNKVFLKYGAEDLKTLGMKKKLGLQPVKDIYLYATYGKGSPRVTFLYVVASIAIFILLIACINFMNLSTAKAAKRANEVGLRKTLGAQRSSLVMQFLGEAFVIVVSAILLSLILVQIFLPFFNQLTLKQIGFDSDNLLFFFLALTGIAIVTGIVAGSYPAFYLSSFQPAKVLKGKFALSNSGSFIRKLLVVFQFVIAITLVCGMFMITRQLKYMLEKDLGFSADNKIVLPLRSDDARSNHRPLRDELSGLASVRGVTGSAYIPGAHILSDFSVYPEGSSMERSVMIKNSWVEPNFMDMLGIRLIAGRQFTSNREAERGKIILNRIAVRKLGFDPQEIVGQVVYNDYSGGRAAYEVIGVMEDYHQVSLKQEIYPVLFRLADNESFHDYMLLDIAGGDVERTIAGIAEVWKNINSGTPFEYTFLDENVKRQYHEDKRVSLVITCFTVIAIIISCLGLYGLSNYMAEQRIKEIGVRKIMGATVSQIVQMMSGEFVKLVVLAFIIAVPIAWYVITMWLEGFAYKAPLNFMLFVVAGVSALAIALLTVSFESVKAASGSPINALRNE